MSHQIRPDLCVEFGPTDDDETFILTQSDEAIQQARSAIIECGLQPEVTHIGDGRSELRVHVNKMTMPFDVWSAALRVLNPGATSRTASIRAYRSF